MTASVGYSLAIVAVMAGVTFAIRAFPFLFFGRHVPPRWLLYLGSVLPSAIIAMLVVYCFRSTPITAAPHGLPELLASAAVIALHVWKRSNLLSILAGTVLYMYLVQVVFA